MSRLDHLKSLRAKLDLEIAREEAFQSRIRRVTTAAKFALQRVSLDWDQQVIVAVAAHYGIGADDITGPSRTIIHVEARHVCAWILRQSAWTFPAIGRALGGRDHTTAMNAVSRVDNSERLGAVASLIEHDLTGQGEGAA